jgi:hypothetical protein
MFGPFLFKKVRPSASLHASLPPCLPASLPASSYLFSLSASLAFFLTLKLITQIGAENMKIKRQEDQLRELFVKDRSHYRLNDPNLNLINVYNDVNNFRYLPETSEERMFFFTGAKPGWRSLESFSKPEFF